MFVRFRETPYRLQLSLVETRRADGKVRHEHVASLGSIETPPTVADRVAFWARLHERLARLSNRLDGEAQGKVLGAVHARVPMVTADEQRVLQLENAKADAGQWSRLHGMHAATVEDHKALAATVAASIAEGESDVAQTAASAKAAQERVERIERGENVEGGLGRPATREDFQAALIKAGFTREELRHGEVLYELRELGAFKPDADDDELQREMSGRTERARYAAARAVLRRHRSR
jgi:hypothetical protein